MKKKEEYLDDGVVGAGFDLRAVPVARLHHHLRVVAHEHLVKTKRQGLEGVRDSGLRFGDSGVWLRFRLRIGSA